MTRKCPQMTSRAPRNEIGTGSPISRPTFWDQFELGGYPQICPRRTQNDPLMAQNAYKSPHWSERGTKFGTGSPMSRPTFWDQLRSDGYPQIWSGGPKNGCRTIFQLSLAKIGGTPHSQLVQKGQLGRLITCSNIVPRCTICFEPLGALAVILGHFG